MWTVPLTAVLPGMSNGPQFSTWLPSAPLMEQVEPVPVEAWIVQWRPALPGRLSEIVAPWAVPAVLLPQVRVNPIWLPALTVAASAVLPIVTVAQSTMTEPLSGLLVRLSLGSFVAVADAVLLTVPQF